MKRVVDGDVQRKGPNIITGQTVQESYRALMSFRQGLHPLQSLFPFLIVPLQLLPVGFEVGKVLLQLGLLALGFLQAGGLGFQPLSHRGDFLICHIGVPQQVPPGLQRILFGDQSAGALPRFRNGHLLGIDLAFQEAPVTLHVVGPLDVVEANPYLGYEIIRLLGEGAGVILILTVPSAHDVRHRHIVQHRLCDQIKAVDECLAEHADNLFFVDLLSVADVLSVVQRRSRAKPDAVVFCIADVEVPATVGAGQAAGKSVQRLLL